MQGEKSVTPRGIYNASCALQNVDFNKEKDVYKAIALCVGEGFAMEFLAYYKHVKALDWEALEKDPTLVEDYDTEKQYAVMGSAVAKIKISANEEWSDIGTFLSSIVAPLTVVAYLPSDFVMATIKQFVTLKVNIKDKNNSANVTLANILCKLMLFGAKKFKEATSFSKESIAKMDALQKVFNTKHAKIFSKI